MQAIRAFEKQEENIKHLLRAADIYTQHVLSSIRGKSVDLDLINKIIEKEGMSTLNYSWRWYLSLEEYEQLREEGQTRKICEEIVLAIYTAVECFLIEKFKEYLRHQLSDNPEHLSIAIENRITFRSLDQIKKNYKDYLGIHIPSFEPELSGIEDSWFCPKTSWEGLKMLSRARNEIAHNGSSDTYKIFYLLDAYSPLHFSSLWVALFNSNFDSMIYENLRSEYVQEHDRKMRISEA